MRLAYFGGLAVDGVAATSIERGRGQSALLLRLAVDTGTVVSSATLAEDIWGLDQPADPRASLQSLVSRLRKALPSGLIEAAPRGYRLTLTRDDVDLTAFQDLVAHARTAPDAATATSLAHTALALWSGEPLAPVDSLDWIVRDLRDDHAHAERLARMTVSSAATPVPAAALSLVGRGAELDLIRSQLATERLVTILGPGGAGKTTLAMEIARETKEVVVVELAPASAGEVWDAVAGAVGRGIRLTDSSTMVLVSARDRVLRSLSGRSTLIVLDNCEHVIDEANDVADVLLRGVSGARILTTSREPLGLSAEAFVDVGPLPEGDAIELFARRVRAARGTPPSPEDAATAARIVRRLDGLPLALELAAARARTLTLAEIDQGLDDRFSLLGHGPRGSERRHRTLRALIDWSWETLSEPERIALRALSVFPDGISVTAAPDVAAGFGTHDDAFDLLVDRSLLVRADGRFRMLETVREYGLDTLRADGDVENYRRIQAGIVADDATAADALLRGPRALAGLAWFDANDENRGAALRTCSEQADLHETGVRLVRASLWEWMMRERIEDLQRGITAFGTADSPLDSEPAVVVQGIRLVFETFLRAREADAATTDGVGSHEDAAVDLTGFHAHATAIAEAADRHPSELSAALPSLLAAVEHGISERTPGAQWPQGFALSLNEPEDAPDWTLALLAVLRAGIAQNSGDTVTLGVESERGLRLFRALGDVWGIAFASQLRSEWLMLQGRLDEALTVADDSTRGLTGLTSVPDIIQQRTLAITTLVRLGRIDDARDRLVSVMADAVAEGSERSIMQAGFAAASVDIAAGDGTAALRHLGAIQFDLTRGPFEQLTAARGAMRARAYLLEHRPDEAREALREAIAPALHSGDQPIIAEVALSVAAWLAAVGREDEARRVFAASVSVRGMLDATDPSVVRLRARLGDTPKTATGSSPAAALAELKTLGDLLD